MKATFLGHGLDSKNKNNVGKQLAVSFDSSNYEVFNGFVAFASISGVSMLLSHVQKAKLKYRQIRFYIGVDNRGTSKEALELLLKENVETFIYHDKNDYVTYHPKLFIFEGSKFTRIIIGSSNLTSSGIKSNIEASIQVDFRTQTDTQGNKILTEIKEYYSELLDLSSTKLKLLTQELLDELLKQNLLFHQFDSNNKVKESKTSDGENKDQIQDTIELPDFDIDSGFNQIDTIAKRSKKRFNENDYEKFDTLLNRYIIYKRDQRPSGIVSKKTEDRELLNWYRRMSALYNDNSLPTVIFDRLIDADFPFGGEGIERKRLIKWDKDFQKLVDYKRLVDPKSKVTHVPQFTNKSNPYYNLAVWCVAQKQRKKGNYTPLWTQYEEDKLNSINFLWEASTAGIRPKDDEWTDNLVDLENYYSKAENYKTVPSQQTKVGHWLNDQMTLKLKGSRGKSKKFLNPIREKLLGDLINSNGVEWEWEKQKHREGIENKIQSWRILEALTNSGELKKILETDKKRIKKYRDDVTQLRSQSKKWKNEKNRWKYEILDKEGFPYEK